MPRITKGMISSQSASTNGYNRNSGTQMANHRNLIHMIIGGITTFS